MAEEKKVPLIVKIHNATCPAWVLNIGLLKKMEPGCHIASGYDN